VGLPVKLLLKLMIAGGAISAPARTYPASFNVLLSSPVGATIGDGTGVVTINNNPIVPSFTMTRTTGVAPLGVHFDASGTTATTLTSKPFHDLYYAWSFGDPAGGATWAYGTRPGVASKNTAYGPIAAHVFETPGTYTATLWVYHLDSGGTLRSASKVGSTSITVTDPDVVFDTAHTIYVSQSTTPTPGANGVPSGANVLNMPNWSTLKTLVGTNGYRRIRLMRGDTWNVDAWADFPNATWNGPGLIDAYGTGAKPIVSSQIDAPCFRMAAGANDWRVVDVVATSSDLVGTEIGNRNSFSFGGNNIALLRCETSGTRAGVLAAGNSGLYVVDSVIGATAQYNGCIGVYTDKVDYQAFMGSSFTGSWDHGGRLQGTSKTTVNNCYIGEVAKAAGGYALTLRGKCNDAANATWNGLWTEDVVLSDNIIKNNTGFGIDALAIKPQSNNNHAERLRNIICERNLIQSAGTWGAALLEVANDVTFRNNICIVEDAEVVITVQGNNPNSPAPVGTKIYNNTAYKPSGANNNLLVIRITDPGPTYVTMRNNIGYAPGCTFNGSGGPASMFGTTQTGGAELTHVLENNSSNAQLIGTSPWASATPVAAADFTPSASYAVDSGVYVPIVDDYFSTQITGTRDMGAIQP